MPPHDFESDKAVLSALLLENAAIHSVYTELKPDDYTQAYRAIAGAFDEPAMTLHYKAEGRQAYAVLLFLIMMTLGYFYVRALTQGERREAAP